MSKQPEGAQVDGLKLPISRLVLGTMTFGDTVDEATAGRMVDEALDAGITTIDTANAYVGGATEEMLVPPPEGTPRRVILASKAGMPHADHGANSPLSPAGLRASVEGSLRRLGVDSIDLFYLHQPDRATPLHETLATVAELVAEGKIGALGVSNFAAWQIADVIHTAREVGAPQPVVAQQLYNLVARRLEEEYLEFAATHNVHTMVYNPLGGGLLTGKHSFDAKPTEGRFGDSKLAAMYTQRYWDKQLFDAIGELSRHRRRTPASRWPSCRCAGWPTATAWAPCCWAAPRWSSCRPTSPPWPTGRCRPTSWKPATPSAPRSAARCPPTTADLFPLRLNRTSFLNRTD